MIKDTRREYSFRQLITIAGIVLIAMNLRAPITSVGPVLSEISASLGLSTVQAGLLTTIPVLAFGLFSGLVSGMARRFSMESLLLFSLALLAAGLLTRSAGSLAPLYLGTAMIGCAITVGNVLMPAYLKLNFSHRLGIMTGLYAGFMNLFAALASGFSLGLGQWSGWGWQGSLGLWALLAGLAFLIWLPSVRKSNSEAGDDKAGGRRVLWKSSSLAWIITGYMGLQSILFYSLVTWLPEMLRDWGMSPEQAGWTLSYTQMAQLPALFGGPVLAARMKSQVPLMWITGILLLSGLSGIFFMKTAFIVPSIILIGLSLGMTFSLAMLFIPLRSADGKVAASLSGMAQSFGYLFAASGPVVFGFLHDLSGGWVWPQVFLLLMTVCMLVFGLQSARNRLV